jgi:hypothetical protein
MGIGFNNWGCHLEGNEENEWTTLNMFVVDHDFLNTFSMQMDPDFRNHRSSRYLVPAE